MCRYAAVDREQIEQPRPCILPTVCRYQSGAVCPVRSCHRVKFRTGHRVFPLSAYSRERGKIRSRLHHFGKFAFCASAIFGFSALISANCTKCLFGAIYQNSKNRAFASFLQTRGVIILNLLLFIRQFIAVYTVCKLPNQVLSASS